MMKHFFFDLITFLMVMLVIYEFLNSFFSCKFAGCKKLWKRKIF